MDTTDVNTAPEALIEFRKLSKAFGDKPVLREVDLVVRRAETLVILGASGSGKSVLLRHIVGLLKADSGQVMVEGEDVARMDDEELLHLRRRIALIFQGNALFDSLTIAENVAFGLREQRRLTSQEIETRVGAALAKVGLDHTAALRPSSLSGGMRKRAALARSMVLQPEALLYDEPTSGLDPVTGHMVSRLIRDTAREHRMTSVVVTHDIASAMLVADRLALLSKGRMLFRGTAAEAKGSQLRELREFLDAYEEEHAS